MIAEGLFLLFKDLLFCLGMIGNNGSFPDPLSPQDEKMYLDRYYNGDKEARRVLIEHNLRLVAHICKKFNSKNTENDDLISIGTIGLIKAISTYNPKKNVQLATYAARCIENAILSLWNIIEYANKIIETEYSLNYNFLLKS